MKSDEMNDKILSLTRIDVNKAITERVCPFCSNPVGEFRDSLSRREFEISGLCQNCQDEVFGEEKDPKNIISSPLPVEFHEVLSHIPEVMNILENVDGVFLAGGLLRSLVGGEDINPQSTDIDLFFGHPEILEGIKKYLDVSHYEKVFQCPENKLATYIYKREGKPEWKLQLISVDYYENAEEVIKTFDFTVTMFSTDGENFYQGETSQEDVNNRELVWNEITYPASSLRRMMKYARKGYHMKEESYQLFVEKCWSHDSMIRDEKLVYVD